VVDRRVKPQRRVARWEGGGGSRLGLAAASGERVPGAPIREGAPEPGTAVEAFGIRPRIRRSVRVGRICEKPVNACRLPKSLAEALPWKRDPTNLAAAGPEGSQESFGGRVPHSLNRPMRRGRYGFPGPMAGGSPGGSRAPSSLGCSGESPRAPARARGLAVRRWLVAPGAAAAREHCDHDDDRRDDG
jgi:hypothetical protein